MPRRAAKETRAQLRAECGSFCVAWRARFADGSYMAFSYLSQASSSDLRASSDLVERGMALKSYCASGTTGDARAPERLEAGSMRGAAVCDKALAAGIPGKISRNQRATTLAMSNHSWSES